MIQQDYFLRVLEEFFAAIALFLEKKKENKDDDLKDLYRQYVGDYTLLRNMSVEELIAYAQDEWKATERVQRLEMVAELLYVEASYKVNPLRAMLLEKAYNLFAYVDAHHNVYSMDRKAKMTKIREALGR